MAKLTRETLVARAREVERQLGAVPSLTRFLQASRTDPGAVRRCGGWDAIAAEAFGDDYDQRLAVSKAKDEGEPTFEREGRALDELLDRDTFVFTCAQNNTPVESGFFAALKAYAQAKEATLGVIPVRYKNPTSRRDPSEDAAKEDNKIWWADELLEHMVENSLRIAPDLVVLANVRIQATSPNPLSGLGGRSKGSSAVFGHPKLMMTTIATPQNKAAKILYTTGSVTRKNYSTTKLGDLAAFHHMHSAIVIEREGEKWWMRSLIWDGEAFYDVEERWTADGFEGTRRALGLCTGDEHARFNDPVVREATYGPQGICAVARPLEVVRNDVLDADTINWHERNNTILRAVKAANGRSDLRAELDECIQFIRETTPPDASNVIVPSNHDERVDRWLAGSDSQVDPENLLLYYELKAEILRSARITRDGVAYDSAFASYAKRAGLERTRFFSRDESHLIGGIEVILHGDEGANGASGSARGFAQLGVRTVTAHKHGPYIYEGNWGVGTSTYIRLGYNRRGPSSWAQAHCLIHENARRQMLFIQHGRFRR